MDIPVWDSFLKELEAVVAKLAVGESEAPAVGLGEALVAVVAVGEGGIPAATAASTSNTAEGASVPTAASEETYLEVSKPSIAAAFAADFTW
jgi:hypothetical protein